MENRLSLARLLSMGLLPIGLMSAPVFATDTIAPDAEIAADASSVPDDAESGDHSSGNDHGSGQVPSSDETSETIVPPPERTRGRPNEFEKMQAHFGFKRLSDKKYFKIVDKAATKPLGSNANPVRASLPSGQHAYLSRLRCADGAPPSYFRVGNVGPGIYRTIVDAYSVSCKGDDPEKTTIYMDMYHGGHIEKAPVPGFDIVAP